jgi:hypothetical protein
MASKAVIMLELFLTAAALWTLQTHLGVYGQKVRIWNLSNNHGCALTSMAV